MKKSEDLMKGFNDFMEGVKHLEEAEELLGDVWRLLGPYASFVEKGLKCDPQHTPVIVPGHLCSMNEKEFEQFMMKLQNFFGFDDSE